MNLRLQLLQVALQNNNTNSKNCNQSSVQVVCQTQRFVRNILPKCYKFLANKTIYSRQSHRATIKISLSDFNIGRSGSFQCCPLSGRLVKYLRLKLLAFYFMPFLLKFKHSTLSNVIFRFNVLSIRAIDVMGVTD